MNFDYDVCVVGAGPVGSTISYYLSLKGLSVVLLDKKTKIGYPLQCAGILSSHVEDFNELPEDIILNKVKGAFLHSPNQILKVEKSSDVAYVIDRVAYDQFLLKRAIGSGVKLIYKKAIDFDIDEGLVTLQNNQIIKSKIIVGCDGYDLDLSNHMLLSNDDLDYLFSKLNENDGEELISKYGDMDNQSKLVKEAIKRGLIFKVIPSFLFKNV